MPQIAEISPGFTVEEFVFLARFSHTGRFGAMAGADRDAVNAAFIMTGTGDLRRRRLSELSGGERQMVFLAQCLAQQPRLLLLDEPTAHLDIAHQVKIMDVLKKLNSQGGLTTIAILHDLNLASEYCRKLILLDNGRIYREGVVDEILTYQNIEAVYKTAVVVEKNPFSKKPYIMLTSDQLDKRNEGAIPSVPNVTHYLGDTSGPRSVA
jgi:iron complex transport system ATP-binding protein